MDARLLEILVCPVCKGPLQHHKVSTERAHAELVCRPCRLAFAIKDDIPVMLESEARQLDANEAAQA
jgi:uncharacterized protein YbaR (Trm112 family)